MKEIAFIQDFRGVKYELAINCEIYEFKNTLYRLRNFNIMGTLA